MQQTKEKYVSQNRNDGGYREKKDWKEGEKKSMHRIPNHDYECKNHLKKYS